MLAHVDQNNGKSEYNNNSNSQERRNTKLPIADSTLRLVFYSFICFISYFYLGVFGIPKHIYEEPFLTPSLGKNNKNILKNAIKSLLKKMESQTRRQIYIYRTKERKSINGKSIKYILYYIVV